MSRSVFGWSLPPGCSFRDLPGNEPEYCSMCGVTNLNDCKCPECPECSAVGCLEHMDDVTLLIQFDGRQAEVTRRENQTRKCLEHGCRKQVKRNLRYEVDGDPDAGRCEKHRYNPEEEAQINREAAEELQRIADDMDAAEKLGRK